MILENCSKRSPIQSYFNSKLPTQSICNSSFTKILLSTFLYKSYLLTATQLNPIFALYFPAMAIPESGMDDPATDTFRFFLESQGLEFLLSREGKVPLSTLDGKRICLYFTGNWCRPCRNFTPQLLQIYNELQRRGENFEIIFISFDKEESSFNDHLKSVPWLAFPFDYDFLRRLCARYRVDWIPALIPLNLAGKTAEPDAVQLVEDYGIEGFPFSSERTEELKALDEKKRNGSDLMDLLLSGDRDYVNAGNGTKVRIADLHGKTIGLYFAAHWCPPCRIFTTQLIDAYNKLKITQINSFEVILVSTDRDEDSFNQNLNSMPWLAIPYDDKIRNELCRIFGVKRIPMLVLLGPDGKALSTNGRGMISSHGAEAFPFTESRAAEIEAALRKEGEGLIGEVKDPKHEHVLKLDMAKAYICNSCKREGKFWVYSCQKCDFDLHLGCVVNDVKENENLC